MAAEEITAQRVFELYVDQLRADSQAQSEALVVRLKWFGESIETTSKRLLEDPSSAVELVKVLSTIMQDLDARAGAVEAQRESLQSALRFAILIPETSIHG